MELSNREIATLIWMAIFLAWALSVPKVRKSLGGVLKAFCKHQILIPLAVASVYIFGCVVALSAMGVWQWSSLKTTLIWSVTFAFVAMFDINRVTEDSMYFRKTLRDIFGATVIVVFIAELYSFSLLTEVSLLPVLAFLVLVYTVSETRPELEKVKNVLGWVVGGAGLVILTYGIRRIVMGFEGVATWSTAREFAIPILLSVMFLPFIYVLSIYATYGTVFTLVGLRIADSELLRYAKRQAILTFKGDLDFLRRWSRYVAMHNPESREDVRRSIEHIKGVKRRERNPPVVPEGDGWSPYTAKEFLREENLATGDYHQLGEEWFASSPYVEIGEGILPDNVAYYVEGDEIAVKCLKLILNVNNPSDSSAAEERFLLQVRALLTKALGERAGEGIGRRIIRDREFQESVAGGNVSLVREDWIGGRPGGFSLKLTITKPSHPPGSDREAAG